METITQPDDFSRFIRVKPAPAVCFHSPYSAYSRRTLAMLREIEPQFPSAAFGQVNVDGSGFTELVRRYAIVALPTVILFRGEAHTVMFLGERSVGSWVKLLTTWLPVAAVHQKAP